MIVKKKMKKRAVYGNGNDLMMMTMMYVFNAYFNVVPDVPSNKNEKCDLKTFYFPPLFVKLL